MKPLLLILLLPAFASAQEVRPVISKDYLDLIHKDSLTNAVDSTNSVRNSSWTLKNYYTPTGVGSIITKNQKIVVKPLRSKALRITGGFNSTVEFKSINHRPETQDRYVQGRTVNGNLTWRGAETGEMFSYGPLASSLEFDGTNYSYDADGRLVPLGTGSGMKARTYDNSVFRMADALSHSLVLQSLYSVSGRPKLTAITRMGQSTENTFLKNNINRNENISTSAESYIKDITIKAEYASQRDRFTKSNRNGLLNRVYQNSLLSPISFDNHFARTIANTQKSFSDQFDNPYSLLESEPNNFSQSHRTGSLVFSGRAANFKFSFLQSLEGLDQKNNEIFPSGTAYFPNGIQNTRRQRDQNYFLKANTEFTFNQFLNESGYNFLHSTITLNYVFSSAKSNVDYTAGGSSYRYHRDEQDLSLDYLAIHQGKGYEAGMEMQDKIYISNTATSRALFLPSVSAYIQVYDLITDRLKAKLSGSFNRFNSELPIDHSFSSSSLLYNSTKDAPGYFPVVEASGFRDLSPIRHKEFITALELNYKYILFLTAELFGHSVYDDVFPVLLTNRIDLQNMADHKSRNFELQLKWNSNGRKIYISNAISFSTEKSRVTFVRPGFDGSPMAGFSDVYKALIEGQPLGVIVGSRYLRDQANHIVIGNDGFPIMDATPAVIGHPNPDFIMKVSHGLSWKKFDFNFDWEWKKGGDMWNGTASALDYYGRSKTSADLRNTTNYIFPGVLQDGHPNNIPVTFYDLFQPVEKNRWTRYGPGGIAEEYIQRADYIKINNLSVSYRIKSMKHFIQGLSFSVFASNIIIWTPYKGVDPNRLLYDQPGSEGLDFFNLPSTKTFGFNTSIQF